MPELPDITVYLEALDARIVFHRLIRARISSPFARRTAAPFEFASGVLKLKEAGMKMRALTARNHTLERALTDPRILSGIGNACFDEIEKREGAS